MDGSRFDDLSRKMAAGISRRGAAKAAAAGMLAALGVGKAADAQATQASCGNVACGRNACRCNPGCVCCTYANGNSRCRPPGQCHPGTESVCAPPTTTPAPTTTLPPVPTCTQSTTSGGQDGSTTNHELGRPGPTSFQLTYDMGEVPDQLQVFYEGVNIYDTGDLVDGTQTVTVTVPAGSSTQVTVVVTAPLFGTNWEYTVFCPA